jgi:hypothetical protein
MCAVLITQPEVAHYLNNTQPTKICNFHGGPPCFHITHRPHFFRHRSYMHQLYMWSQNTHPGLPLKVESSAMRNLGQMGIYIRT